MKALAHALGRTATLFLTVVVLSSPAAGVLTAQQRANPDFDPAVSDPAHPPGRGPRVLFDEAHHNFHTADGRYEPFVRLITADGFRISTSRIPFSPRSLAGHDILVISSARGAPAGQPEQANPAFTDAEADAVRDWVHGGGALLLITDHPPAATPPRALAERFGITLVNASPRDTVQFWGSPGWLVFTRAHGTLGDHPITRGRLRGERIERVVTFAGNSIVPPSEGAVLLKLAPSAREGYDRPPAGDTAISVIVPAIGTAQGIALTHGRGRVVALGEAAAWTSQVFGDGPDVTGMDEPGFHNRQFILNVMRWLGGSLPEAVTKLPAPDPDFDPAVARATHAAPGPRVVIDAGHHNLFTAEGRYGLLAALLTADGYRTAGHGGRFTRTALGSADVLVIAGPRAAAIECGTAVLWLGREDCAAARDAFTATEIAVVEQWVRGGGALLLALDAFPSGAAGRAMAGAFGVDATGGIVLDWMHRAGAGGDWVTFDSDSGTVVEHAATRGVQRAVVFGATSLSVPGAASALLAFASPAIEQLPARARGDSTEMRYITDLARRAAGVALPWGRGRVVVLGDADFLTSQVVNDAEMAVGLDGPPGYGNRRFALALFRWLSERRE